MTPAPVAALALLALVATASAASAAPVERCDQRPLIALGAVTARIGVYLKNKDAEPGALTAFIIGVSNDTLKILDR